MSILSSLKPERVFYYFEAISQIPRESGSEEKIAEYIRKTACEFGHSAIKDANNNVFVKVKASKGKENSKTVLLQGHTDMVCEKNAGTEHDFFKDPIKLVLNRDFISAEGTTLGADDGIAVAIMLALMEDTSLVHGPLECLFTTEEETGLCGMKAFDKKLINADYMINLDSENSSCATVSCAGGVRTDFVFKDIPLEKCNNELTITVSGLAGGHSGADINLGRANANKIAFELVSQIKGAKLIAVSGGNKDNAIPRECTVKFTCDDPAYAVEVMNDYAETIKDNLCVQDSGFKLECSYKRVETHCFAEKYSRDVITLMTSLPCGVLEMSETVENFVQTSTSVGIVRSNGANIHITSSSRSSSETSLDSVVATLESLGKFASATEITNRDRYPAWDLTDNSKLQAIYRETYTELFKEEPEITGIHAGLECGLIKSEKPDIDIISVGPDAYDIHTPDERLSVKSTEKIYKLLTAILERIAED